AWSRTGAGTLAVVRSDSQSWRWRLEVSWRSGSVLWRTAVDDCLDHYAFDQWLHGRLHGHLEEAVRANTPQSGPHDSSILFAAFARPRADSRKSGGDQSPLRRGGSNCRSALYFEPAMGAVLMA